MGSRRGRRCVVGRAYVEIVWIQASMQQRGEYEKGRRDTSVAAVCLRAAARGRNGTKAVGSARVAAPPPRWTVDVRSLDVTPECRGIFGDAMRGSARGFWPSPGTRGAPLDCVRLVRGRGPLRRTPWKSHPLMSSPPGGSSARRRRAPAA